MEKFEPGARQLITAGKAYLKSLHGASAAAKVYMESLGRLARQAQQATWGDAADVGGALSQIVDVYREIQAQQLSLLKAFYVDLLVPLETNLEKDTKVMQAEQRRFQQTLKGRQEAYHKASAAVKKMQKKSRATRTCSANIDKELKNMQTLEEEKCNLDGFCEQSLRSVLTQERRRYGFVLERQCSLSKHYLAYHDKGQALIQHHLEDWQDIAQTREFLPDSVEATLPCLVPIEGSLYRLVDGIVDESDNADLHDLHARCTLFTPPRKTRSMDAACLDMKSMDEIPSRMSMLNGRRRVQGEPGSRASDRERERQRHEAESRLRLGPSPVPPLTRAKSEFNLSSSRQSLDPDSSSRPRSMAVNDDAPRRPMVRALYSYLSSGDFQLSFHEGDLIAIAGDRNKGWQYGENLRSRRCGWFPVAYTESIAEEEDDELTPSSTPRRSRRRRVSSTTLASTVLSPTFDPFSLHRPNLFSRTASCPPSSSASGSKVSSVGSIPSSPSPASTCTSSASGVTGTSLSQQPPDLNLSVTSAGEDAEDDVHAALPTYPLPDISQVSEVRRMRRSLTSPAPLLPPPQATHVTLHRSNDSGLGAESNTHPPAGAAEVIDDQTKREERDVHEPRNVFATVKLRKTFTNDRSAPRIS